MSHTVESFLNINEVMEKLTLVLQVCLNYDSADEDQFQCAPPSSKSSLLFG
ncbi:hypothetical protein DPMN_167878 [Dreissena polymorpha]|uniref:Uncharacterized protein n=1 Tax=Dreissena polymorpha TaxID=45954 RepID=A0A9D4F5D2_DREPO|nr:hypothetical protein DPMN_167878 [Dreissena polymorpha]